MPNTDIARVFGVFGAPYYTFYFCDIFKPRSQRFRIGVCLAFVWEAR